MILNSLRTPAAFAFAALLLASPAWTQTRPTSPQSAYGGTTVEEIIARVNDQIISRSDYERARAERDQEARQRGASMQEISLGHKDLLRDLIDQQLWLAKGKELGITGETELINRLNDIRKQYGLATMEDLEKAAKDQGVSFEDFKANIRNQIITQQVMRDQVGRKIAPTPGEVQRYFEAHKQEYVQPESVKLSEILISTGSNPDDQAKVAEAKAKADDIEARLHSGGDFAQLARSFSDGTTAGQGGDMGQYKRGQLDKLFEDKTFPLKAGEYTEPIRTKQGFVIFKVDQHVQGGVPEFKNVEADVEQNYFMAKMEPAMRDYLSKMRDEAAIYIKPGYEDSAATAAEKHPSITFSAYVPPNAKKKKKVERTRFRETTHTYRQKTRLTPLPDDQAKEAAPAGKSKKASKKDAADQNQPSMKAGKKEKIRFGKAPTQTLPEAPSTPTEDAGAGQPQVAATAPEPENPLEATSKPEKKTRFSARAKLPKQPKPKGPQLDPEAPPPPDAAEVADRQSQAGPLGLGGNLTPDKKKKKATTTGDKTRLSDKKKADQKPEDTGERTLGPAQEPAPAPATTPAPAPQQ